MNKKGFTLVELVVVVTILSVLATIGFVSYSSHLASTRDTNRITQLSALHDGLIQYSVKKKLFIPENKIDVTVGSTIIGYQGFISGDVLESIQYTKTGKDPEDDEFFSYYLSAEKRHFQLLGFLEEGTSNLLSSTIIPHTQAIDYTERFPLVIGKQLGILTDSDNTPINSIDTIITAGSLDIKNTPNIYKSFYTTTNVITGTGVALGQMNPKSSCKRILDLNPRAKDGIFKIDPHSDGVGYNVHCDMTTDGGGWTMATMLADNTTKNLFDTGNTAKITSFTSGISSKGKISDVWVDESDKDIYIKCVTNTSGLYNYNIPTIIYDYKKSEINNLEKSIKAGTTFSSTNLEGSWNGNLFTLHTDYGPSGSTEAMYIRVSSNGDKIINMSSSNNFRVNSSDYINGASYTSGPEITQTIDTNNYCITAIR